MKTLRFYRLVAHRPRNEKNKINNSLNAWDYYFYPLNKYSINEVYKSNCVIITDGKTRKIKEFDTFYNLNYEHYKIFKKMIKFKPFLINYVNSFLDNNFYKEKVLGVHFRGTDMKTQERHPFPATEEQITNVIDRELEKNKFTKIFVNI
jgi:mannosyltransferase OCH1-like enzyme